jgi:hypothetical protein
MQTFQWGVISRPSRRINELSPPGRGIVQLSSCQKEKDHTAQRSSGAAHHNTGRFSNEKSNLPVALRPFWDARHQLAIDDADDMLVYGARIVLPRSMVKETIQALVGMH